MSVPSSWKNVEIMQQCEHGISMEKVKSMLDNWESVKDFCYIKHGGIDSPEPEEKEHIHVFLRFRSSVPTDAIIAKCKRFGISIKAQNLEHVKSWNKAVAYLTHEAVDKPKYDRSGIVANFDTSPIIDKEVRAKQLRIDSDRLLEIIDMIDKGQIKDYNMHEHVSNVEYTTYKRKIKDAQEYRKTRLLSEIGKGRKMEVIFISGPSGVGKDTYAHDIAKERNLVIYPTSNSDKPFDDYKGQPCIIWSDGRDNERKPQEVLRLLDNNFASAEHARYSNIVLECELFIITSIKPIEEWYKDAFGNNEESRKQLFRRIRTNIKMDFENIHLYVYSEKHSEYMYLGDMPNTITDRFQEQDLSNEDVAMEFLQKTLGKAVNLTKNLKTFVDNKEWKSTDVKTEIPFD